MKNWSPLEAVPPHILTAYPDTLRRMLFARGIVTEDTAEKFLHPDYERDLYDPSLFKDMDRALVRIFEAIEAKEEIVIYSDYDCDGIPAAVIMSDLFKKIGYDTVHFYIPDRQDEGYGLHHDAIKDFIGHGAKLLITFDLGITAAKEVAYATANGLDVIITDHHLPHGDLPRAYAIINPHLEDSGYPEAVLSGAGVAWKLLQGFVKKYGEYFNIPDGFEKWSLDMAALGTLSDMVPITGENRAISYFGMKVLQKNRRPGLAALLELLRINANYLSEDDLAFMVVPRINAASRMDSPKKAFALLSATSRDVAIPLAQELSRINDDRKALVARIMKDVKKTVAKREEKEVVVIGNPTWRAGILGLVAGKLTDEYKKPSFVWGMEEGEDRIKGSCRGAGGINVVELMTVATEHFVSFGGHKNAGGFVTTKEKVHFLESALSEAYLRVKSIESATVVPDFICTATLPVSLVNRKTVELVHSFAPFGFQNEKPIFVFQNVTLANIKEFGKAKEHLEVTIVDGEARATAIAFFKTKNDFGKDLLEGDSISLAGTLEMSYFRGSAEVRLRIVDIF